MVAFAINHLHYPSAPICFLINYSTLICFLINLVTYSNIVMGHALIIKDRLGE